MGDSRRATCAGLLLDRRLPCLRCASNSGADRALARRRQPERSPYRCRRHRTGPQRSLVGLSLHHAPAALYGDPARLVYYFGVFRDDRNRKLLGVRKATQFKGAFKGRFVSVIDDTLRMVADKVFKLDNEFDFLITARHVYVLHPAAFEHIAEIESYAAERAKEKTLALGETVTFLDFTALAEYVEKHRRAARLVAALNGRDDLGTIKKAMFIKAAAETGVVLERSHRKLTPAKGSELGCLELLDHRRYTTALRPGSRPAFIAGSRRPVSL